jgi:tetratricopeptide (TPR) repeat protein
MAKPKLSLCLIARNEEALLPACLASVRGAVDELVVVDTGSTDRTMAIAGEAGAKVLERPWDDDFAAPRNLAAAHATGDFILQLDADEQLAPGGADALRRAVKRAAWDVGLVRCHNADALDAPPAEVLSGARAVGQPGLLPRVIRRTADLRWEGCIHESVLEWAAARGGRIVPVPVDLVHYGYTGAVFATRQKRERNLLLLRKRAAQHPDDVVSLGYLAAELLNDGAVDEAAEVADQGWAVRDRQPAHRSLRRLAVVRAWAAVRRGRPEVALETVRGCEAWQERSPDLSFCAGGALELLAEAAPDAAERARQLQEAERHYGEGLALLDRGGCEQVMYVSAAKCWARLGVVRLRTGRPAEALECFAHARAANPKGGPGPTALGEAEALLLLSRPQEALRALAPVLGAGRDGWALAAQAAVALGAHADAEIFRAKAAGR